MSWLGVDCTFMFHKTVPGNQLRKKTSRNDLYLKKTGINTSRITSARHHIVSITNVYVYRYVFIRNQNDLDWDGTVTEQMSVHRVILT